MTKARENAIPSGLVLLNKTTVTTASTVNITNAFNSTYQNYRVIINPSTVSTTLSLYFNLLSGSTAATSSYYWAQLGYNENGAGDNWAGSNQTYIPVGAGADAYRMPSIVDVFSPNIANATTLQIHYSSQYSALTSRMGSGWHLTATAYDGFKIYTSTGTFSGTIKLYGYRD